MTTMLDRVVTALKKWRRSDRGWPRYLPGGRIRTSTVGLCVAFVLLSWVYENYQPAPAPEAPPANQVVPPGFVPDPEYTWVPRTSVREYPTTTVPRTTTPTTTTTTTEPPPTTTSEPSPTTTTTPPSTTTQNPFLPTPPTPQTSPSLTPTALTPEPGPPPVPPIPGF